MKFTKKIFLILSLSLILNLSFCKEVNALFGNTHYNIGKKIIKIIEKNGIILEGPEKDAFLSGMVYADIGRFKFDKASQIESDCQAFTKEMKKHASTKEEKWFIRGIEMHILQDKKTAEMLKNIFGQKITDYTNYMLKCSIIDSYFLNKNQSYIYSCYLDKFDFNEVSSIINLKLNEKLLKVSDNKNIPSYSAILSQFYTSIKKDSLSSYAELILKTYKALGLNITIEDVYKQEANCVGSFVIASELIGKKYFRPEIGIKIELECTKIAELCVKMLENI